MRQQFGSVEEETQDTIADILEQYTKIIHRRRPEALNPETYHPVQEKESSRIFEEEEQLLKNCRTYMKQLKNESAESVRIYRACILSGIWDNESCEDADSCRLESLLC